MRRLRLSLPVGLLLLVTFFYPMLAPTAHRIDEAHFEQISVGMTLEEVESRFGTPAGSYDWAVAKDPSIVFWDVATGLVVNEGQTISSVTVNPAADDAIVWEFRSAQRSQKLYTSLVTSFTLQHRSSISRTWTSRHGTCTIYFDEHNRVTCKTGWGESRLEPPWHNWRKWLSK